MNPDANVHVSPPDGGAAPVMPEQAAALQLTPDPPAAPGQVIQPSYTALTNGQSNSSPMLPFTNNPVAALADPAPASLPVDDDADETSLEIEYVNQAKQIVLRTVNDPFEQNRQLSVIKADYLQRRYGKVIKLAE